MPVRLNDEIKQEFQLWDSVKTAKESFKDNPLAVSLFEDLVGHYETIETKSTLWYHSIDFDLSILSTFMQCEAYLDWLYESPKDVIKVIETALTSIVKTDTNRTPQVIINVITTKKALPVKKIDARLIGEFVVISGLVRAKSELLGKSVSASYKCDSCKAVIYKDIYLAKYPPKICPRCGNKDGLKLGKQYDSPIYHFTLEDPEMSAAGGSDRVVDVEVMFRNAESDRYESLMLGSQVRVVGILDRRYKKQGSETYSYKLLCRGLEYVETKTKRVITESDKDEFHKLASDPNHMKILVDSLAPTISGMALAKQACLLQLVGGNELVLDNRLNERGNLHVLLVSSPGLAKTQLAKQVTNYLTGSRFTTGKTTSGAGLVCAMMKDEEMGGWYVSAGAVALASGAICVVDELDKISHEDLAYMNSAMVDLKVPIDKAGLHLVLHTKTSILACANPKDRVFDDFEPIWKQIGLPKDFMDRFDLVIPVESPKNDDEIRSIALAMGNKYLPNSRVDTQEVLLSHEYLEKYIEYARTFRPELSVEVMEYIVTNFIILTRPSPSDNVKAKAYLSNRLFTNIMRLSQARAKLRLSNVIIPKDAEDAINILIKSLKAQQIITQDNLMDYSKAEAVPTQEAADKKSIILRTIESLQNKNKEEGKGNYTTYEELYGALKAADKFTDDFEFDRLIDKLVIKGELSHPRGDATLQRLL